MKKKIVRLEYVLYEGQSLTEQLSLILGSISEGKPNGIFPVYQLSTTNWINSTDIHKKDYASYNLQEDRQLLTGGKEHEGH